MTKQIYVLFDKVSKTWTLPFFEINSEKVIRDLENIIKTDEKSELSMNFKDKELYSLGSYDESSGQMNLLSNQELILKLNSLNIKKESN